MSDAENHRPSPDPYVGLLPNGYDIFWWECKSPSHSAMVSSLSQWHEISKHFARGQVVVSLEDSQILVDETVYGLFHNKVIFEKGSWARLNATLRQLYRSLAGTGSGQAENPLPFAVKLGTLTAAASLASGPGLG